MIIEIDNPCYHCYTGAIGECRTIGCKYLKYPWSKDLEADYKVDYDMTDEEMAEEYIKKNNLEWELDCHRTSPIGEVIQAFLAGLKAGRPKWHKVAEGDLPKENQVGQVMCLLLEHKHFDLITYLGDDFSKWKELIAWKEIVPPKESV